MSGRDGDHDSEIPHGKVADPVLSRDGNDSGATGYPLGNCPQSSLRCGMGGVGQRRDVTPLVVVADGADKNGLPTGCRVGYCIQDVLNRQRRRRQPQQPDPRRHASQPTVTSSRRTLRLERTGPRPGVVAARRSLAWVMAKAAVHCRHATERWGE